MVSHRSLAGQVLVLMLRMGSTLATGAGEGEQGREEAGWSGHEEGSSSYERQRVFLGTLF